MGWGFEGFIVSEEGEKIGKVVRGAARCFVSEPVSSNQTMPFHNWMFEN